MGKHSNIILVGNENNIIDGLKHLTTFSGSYRNILPNSQYILPELNKLDVNKISTTSDFYNQIPEEVKNKNISSYFLEHFSGTSKTLIEHAISSTRNL